VYKPLVLTIQRRLRKDKMNMVRDLMIGTVGSIIGALIVVMATSGLRFTRKASRIAFERKAQEKKRWQEGSIAERQEITNGYLFGILRNMLLGNLLWSLPSVVYPFVTRFSFDAVSIVSAAGSFVGAIYFLRGIILVIRYGSLKLATQE
jgi:hypothetical protein